MVAAKPNDASEPLFASNFDICTNQKQWFIS
jgi:hypothetical protein